MSARRVAFGALLLLGAGALVSVLTLGASAPVASVQTPEAMILVAEVPATVPIPARPEPPASREAEPAPARRENPAPPDPIPKAEVGPPPFPGEISGRVVDPSGRAVVGAYVVLGFEVGEVDEDGVAFEPALEPIDSTRTDAEGRYFLSPKRTGSGSVRAEARRFSPASERVEIPDVSTRQRIDFQLIPLPISVIRGFLVSPNGALLPPSLVESLFPVFDWRKGVPVSWIYALTEPFCAWTGPGGIRGEKATIDARTSSFEIEVPRHSERVVTALSSARVIASKVWRDGDPDVRLVIDVPRVGIDAQVVDARTDLPPPDASVVVRIPGGAGEVASIPLGLSFSSLPEGVYDVEARARGLASEVARLEVRGLGPIPVRFRLHPPATVTLHLESAEAWIPEPGRAKVVYRDDRGVEVRDGVEVERGGEPRSLVVRGLPPGRGTLTLAGNVLRVGLSTGAENEFRFPLRNPRRLLVRFRPRAELLGEDGLLDVSASLAARRDLRVVEETRRLRVRRDGSCLLALAAPPGDYAFRMEACGGSEIRRAVRIEEAETTWVAVESP
jgi:carboxypeptidase family protein